MNILAVIDGTYFYSLMFENTSIVDNTYYVPRIAAGPTISKISNDGFYGLSTVDSISIDLHNTDGYFDDLYQSFANKSITIYAGQLSELANYTEIFTGVIRELNNNVNTITLNIYDARVKFEKSIEMTYYSTATYADLNTNNEDKPIPQLWGENFDCPCVCLNELESPTPTNYTFKVCDTSINSLTAINEVYLDDVPITYSNVSLANGTFTITAVALGSNNFKNITADVENSIVNTSNIIRDIIDSNISIGYNEVSFDNAVDNSYIASYYVDKPITISEAVNKLCKDSNISITIEGSGILYFNYFDINKSVKRVIQNHEYSGEPVISNNMNNYASSVLISYAPGRKSGVKKYKRVATYETQASAWYGDTKEIPIDTNLTSLSDVVLKGENFLYIPSEFRETYQRPIRLDESDNIRLLDFVAANPGQRDVNIDNGVYYVYQVLGIIDDYNTMTKMLTMQFIKNFAYVNNFFYLETENLEYITDDQGRAIILGGYV